MACKGCEKRKGWIRRWIGVDQRIDALHKIVVKRNIALMEAGAKLEERVKVLEDEAVRFSEIG